ncbi:unnamed protein product [Dracunculus medinensis]|uniref:Ovule protein n=1 Tax=Dracunculus medinensis TaxID=318479 RepID=A0A0N4UFX4_DRAME|nr:unnamed protein product [Dracunculus medinensis]
MYEPHCFSIDLSENPQYCSNVIPNFLLSVLPDANCQAGNFTKSTNNQLQTNLYEDQIRLGSISYNATAQYPSSVPAVWSLEANMVRFKSPINSINNAYVQEQITSQADVPHHLDVNSMKNASGESNSYLELEKSLAFMNHFSFII